MASSDVHLRICEQEILKLTWKSKLKSRCEYLFVLNECTVAITILSWRQRRKHTPSVAGGSGPPSKLTELNADLKKSFHHLRLRIRDFEQMAMEQDNESDKQAVIGQVEGHRKQMLSTQTGWRKADMATKLSIDTLERLF